MRDYLLFIDTETSGLPKNWDAPFSQAGNWPYALQVSWLIYTKEGQLIKWENFYIRDNDFEITPAAIQIHGITREFLLQQGESRTKVLSLLAADMQQYQPLVVGHFMKFDALVLGADYFRIGQESPMQNLPTFCTMEATKNYVRNPNVRFLRLGDLYYLLFKTTLEQQHNALVDAQATADCFFELLKRGDIHPEVAVHEKTEPILTDKLKKIIRSPKKLKYILLAGILLLFAILIYYWL